MTVTQEAAWRRPSPALARNHAGADVERLVLARAVQWHSEERVIRHGKHTIVFS